MEVLKKILNTIIQIKKIAFYSIHRFPLKILSLRNRFRIKLIHVVRRLFKKLPALVPGAHKLKQTFAYAGICGKRLRKNILLNPFFQNGGIFPLRRAVRHMLFYRRNTGGYIKSPVLKKHVLNYVRS